MAARRAALLQINAADVVHQDWNVLRSCGRQRAPIAGRCGSLDLPQQDWLAVRLSLVQEARGQIHQPMKPASPVERDDGSRSRGTDAHLPSRARLMRTLALLAGL